MNEQEFLIGFLSKTLNMDKDAVASLYLEDGKLKPEALQTVLDKDSERVTSLRGKASELIDNGYKKAQKEIMSKLEAEFKEQTGFTSDKQGIELFTAYADQKLEGAKDKKITDDDVKKHKVYQDLLEAKGKEIKQLTDEWSGKLDGQKKEFERERTFSEIGKAATDYLNGELKAILPTDQSKAQNQLSWYLKDLSEFNFEKQGERTLIMRKDGKVHEDKHGNPYTPEDLFREIAGKYFEFQKSDPKTSPPAPNTGATPPKFRLEKPKSPQDYMSQIETIRNDSTLSDEDRLTKQTELTRMFKDGVPA